MCDKRLARLTDQTKHDRENRFVRTKFWTANLDYFGTFCKIFAKFQINLKRSVMRVWTTNICSEFLDVQKANYRIEKKLFGRRFENGRRTSSHKRREYIEATWKSFGKTALFAATSLQKENEDANRDGAKKNRRQVDLVALVGRLLTLTAESDLLLEDQNVMLLMNRFWGSCGSA